MSAMRAGALAGLVFCILAGPVAAQKLSDGELDLVRGGYLTAAGVTFGFGATVTTLVNGQLALQSTLTVSDGGAVLSQKLGQAGVAEPLTPANARAAGLAGLAGQGVIINGAAGVSAVVQSLTGGQVLNLLVNSANGRTLTQNTAVTITLPNFPALQHNLSSQMTSAALLNSVSVGAISAIRH